MTNVSAKPAAQGNRGDRMLKGDRQGGKLLSSNEQYYEPNMRSNMAKEQQAGERINF